MKVQIYYDSKNPEKPYRAVTTKVGDCESSPMDTLLPKKRESQRIEAMKGLLAPHHIRPKTFYRVIKDGDIPFK